MRAKDFSSLSDPKLGNLLLNGAVGVLPTDTVYGLVCRAADKEAVARLYKLKNRVHQPGPLIAASVEQLEELGVKARYLKAVGHFWPGPVSIEIPMGPELDYLHQSTGREGMRVVSDPEVQKLLAQTGPLLTSSANYPNKPMAGTVAEAKKYFGDKIDFYVDGGDLSNRSVSTIIRIVDDAIEVIRQGAVTISESGRIEK